MLRTNSHDRAARPITGPLGFLPGENFALCALTCQLSVAEEAAVNDLCARAARDLNNDPALLASFAKKLDGLLIVVQTGCNCPRCQARKASGQGPMTFEELLKDLLSGKKP